MPYVVAIGLTTIALLLTVSVEPFLPRTIGAFFYIAIIVTTWYGGLRPGNVSVVLSTLAINYCFLPPRYHFWTERPEDLFQLAIFCLVAFTINVLTSNFRDSKQKIERLSQQLAQENAEQLRMTLSAAQMGMWDWNIGTGEINWSPEHERLFGLTPGTFDGRYETFEACLHPDDREKLHQTVQRSLKARVPYQHEFRIVWADGSIHWIEERGQAFYNEAGHPTKMTGTVMLLDERKQAEAALREREALLRLFIQYVPASIAMLDRDMRYIMASQVWVDEYNLGSIESVMNRSHYEIFPEIPERWRQIHQRCLAGAIEKCDEDLFVRSDGTEQWISWEVHPWYTATREIGGIIIFAVNITKRKQAEIVLRESQIQLQRQLAEIEIIYQSAPIGLNVLDTELRFVRINQRLADMNGLSVEAHIGRTIREVLPDLADAEQLLCSILETGEPLLNVEITGETPAQPGVPRTWLESFLPLKDGDRIIGISTVCEEITARKQAEMALQQLNAELDQRVQERTAELRELNDRLLETVMEQQHTQLILLEQAQLLDLAHDTIMTRDLNSIITFWNEGAESMYGWTKADALGQESHAFLQTQFPKPLVEIESELLKRGYWEGELIHTRQDGSTVTVASRWVMQKDEMGRPLKVLEINNDITLHKQAQTALQQYVEEIEDLYNHAPCGYHSLDAEGNIIRINDTELNWLGCSRDEIFDKKFTDFMTAEGKQVFQENFPQFQQQGWINNLEFEIVSKDGTTRWLSVNATAIKDESGNFIMSRSTLFDITERKRAEQMLELQAVITRNMAEGICLVRADNGVIVYANPKFEQMFGYDCGELNGQHVSIVNYASDPVAAEDVNQAIRSAVLQSGESTYEVHNVKKDGTPFWCSATTSVFRHPDYGDVLVAVHQDITDRKRTEEELKQSEAKFRSLSESSPVGIFMLDIQGQCIYTNPRYQTICGCTFDEPLGDGWVQFIHPEERGEFAAGWSKAVSQRQEFRDEMRYVHKDGSIRFCRVQSAPIFSVADEVTNFSRDAENLAPTRREPLNSPPSLVGKGAGGLGLGLVFPHDVKSKDEVIGYVGTVEDITDSRAVEQMKSEFISIVSHELRTPLTSIRGSLGLLAAGVFKNKPEAAQQMLDIATHDTERLVRLVNDILDLERLESQKVNLVKQWYDAAALLQQSVKTVQPLAAEGNITLRVEAAAVQIWVDCDRMIQTLVNLVSNAIKFSPPKTTVTLSVQDQADRVLFQVKDQGRGIPADQLDTIFGRFQQVDASDSRQKGGTGLGLAICKSIVQQHGGKIWVESVVGEGSSFYFTVPKSLD